jgi:cobalamin biosynthesis protein CbiD
VSQTINYEKKKTKDQIFQKSDRIYLVAVLDWRKYLLNKYSIKKMVKLCICSRTGLIATMDHGFMKASCKYMRIDTGILWRTICLTNGQEEEIDG